MIVIIDTNILISSVIAPSGNEARVIALIQRQAVQAAITNATLMEYKHVLTRPRFSFDPVDVESALHPFRFYSILVHPTRHLTLSPDEADNRFLECAEAARADFLITGNKRHFPDRHGRTRIVNAREFLDVFNASA